MKTGQKTIFNNPATLLQMIALRRAGYATTTLAIMFGVDRSSIEYHCQRFSLKPDRQIYSLERIIADVLIALNPPADPRFKIVNGERINLGKTYAEYMAESLARGLPEGRYPHS